MSLASIVINYGLQDIQQNKNPYGVPRRLLEIIIQYRTYTDIEDMIRVSWIPTGLFNYHNALKYAARYNKRDIVDHFIKEGVIVYNEILEEAAKGGHLDMVKYLLTKLKDNIRYSFDILSNAAYSGNIELFIYLTNYVLVDMADVQCLLKAVEGGHQNMIDYLLDGDYPLSYTVYGLYGALRGGHMHWVNYFLTLGNELSYKSYIHAIEGGHKEAIDIHKKRFPHIPIQRRHEILLKALTYKHYNIVESFLTDELTNDPQMLAEYLSCCIRYCNIQYVKYFISKGARLRSYHRRLAIESDNLDLIKYIYNLLNPQLVAMNDRMEIDGFNGIWSPIIYSSDLQIIDYFLVDIKNYDKTWLDYIMANAIDKGRIYVIKHLLEKGFNNWQLFEAKLYNMERWEETNNPAYTYITTYITTQQIYIDKNKQDIEQTAEQNISDSLETFKSYLNKHVNSWHKKISQFTLFSIASVGFLVYAKVFIKK